jgi:transposase
MSRLEPTLEPKPTEVRRLEVITGAGGRRRWSTEAKARIVEEAMAPGAVVSAIARRHGLTPQQVFTWRREACKEGGLAESVTFAPVVVDSPEVERRSTAPVLEVVVAGAVIRVPRGSDGKTLAMVLRAVKAVL